MSKCILTHAKPDRTLPAHQVQVHYGYPCTIDAEGRLVAEIPEELVPIEIAAGRAELLTDAKGTQKAS